MLAWEGIGRWMMILAMDINSHPPHEGLGDFSITDFFEAIDRQRMARGLSWNEVAKQIWNQSSLLNAKRNDHPISCSTITNMVKLGDTSCQHALFMLRWLGRSPESFVPGLDYDETKTSLPSVGEDRRLRWNLTKVYDSLDARRKEKELTWTQLAAELRCTPSQLTGIKRARFAIGMRLAVRIALWLDCPARDFIYSAKW